MKKRPHALRNFYVKRFGRIFPLYYAIIILFFTLSLIDHPKVALQTGNFSKNIWAYLTFTSNLGDLFNLNLNNLMNPTWSLALEEQYYLIWPLFIIFFSKNSMKFLAPIITILLIIVRLSLIDILSPRGIYEFTLTHADGILIGSTMAIYREKISQLSSKAIYAFVISFIILCIIFTISGTTHPQGKLLQQFGFTVIAIMFGSLLIASIHSKILSNFLSVKWLRVIGQYSFFMYLTHFPLLAAFDQLPLPNGGVSWVIFVLFFIGFLTILGHFSWYCFEKPTAKWIRKIWLCDDHSNINKLDKTTTSSQ